MKKKIIIELETETDDERIFKFLRNFCIDNFQNYKIELEGTSYFTEFNWKEVKKYK
ncbi:MAG: hypothetical protein AABY22_02155 [Nanoarchaeota archaeon]